MDTNQSPTKQWTIEQAVLLSLVCLMVGIGGGWGIRAARHSGAVPQVTVSAPAAEKTAGAGNETPSSSASLKEMADAEAAPLLEKLKSDPRNVGVLTSVGNVYYDAQQYPEAVDYYGRVLQAKPSDAAVRTDMGTAYWYMGNADRAIAEFDKALSYSPNNSNALFNRGLVRWKGKVDAVGAIGDWEKLLQTNPSYAGKSQVEQMLADVKSRAAGRQEPKVN